MPSFFRLLTSLGLVQDFELRPREDELKAAQSPTLMLLEKLAKLPGICLMLPDESLFAKGWREVVCDGRPWYFDVNLLSTIGAKLVARGWSRRFAET